MDSVNTHMLSWMNLLTLLLVNLSSLYVTELSSNLLLSRGGRNRMTALRTKKIDSHKWIVLSAGDKKHVKRVILITL